MGSISLRCPAKINLSLDVIGKREDGYHLLRMIMQSVSLFDVVTIKSGQDNIRVFCENKDVPCNESNIAYKAARLMVEQYEIKDGIHIFIEKNIPIAAGLAGGSTDAAGVIIGINELYKLNLTIQEMMDVGLKIGADVPYCVIGGTALAEGIGERLTRLRPLKETWCVLAKPPIAVSTVEVYKGLKLDQIVEHPETDKLISYIEKEEINTLSQNMINVLETVTINKYPVIPEIKNVMIKFQALGSIMSGSGPTVFGLFEDKDAAESCYNKLKEDFMEVYLVKTCSQGVLSL